MATITLATTPQGTYQVPVFPAVAAACTPSDTDIYDPPVTVYVGGAGAVAIEPAIGGNTVTFSGLAAGSTLPCRARRVLATGTTATLLVVTCP